MTTIVPGYDFGVTEIPISETLLRQARGLQVSGIGVDELEAGIVGIQSGNVSQVTDSIQVGDTVGTIWISPLGDVWVQEQSGAVKLSRIEYGWETRRIHVQQDENTVYQEPGATVHQKAIFGVWEDLDRVEGVATRFSGTPTLKITDDGSYDDNRGGNMWGCIQGDTATSPGRHLRVAFRGLVHFTDRSITDSTFSKEFEMSETMRLKRPFGAAGTTHMLAESYGQIGNASSSKWFGWSGSPSPSSSKISNGIGVLGADYRWSTMLWAFGHMMYTNKDAGP